MIKNITFSVDDRVIRKARQKAFEENRSLNLVVRDMLNSYVGKEETITDVKTFMKQFKHWGIKHTYTREERNAR
jgi:hypothetical protein